MATKYKPRRGGKQTHNQTAQVRNERARDTRRANPASGVQFNSGGEQDRRVINLESGSFTEELPVEYSQPRRRSIVDTERRVGNWEVSADGDKIRATRRFKHGGVVKAPRKKRR